LNLLITQEVYLQTDTNKYLYTTVIDFVEFRFVTKQPTNGFSIKRNTGFVYVEPVNEGAGGAATIFKVRFHDVTFWNDLERSIKKLKSLYELESEPVISTLEVSFDAYSKDSNFDELVEHATNFNTMLANPVSDNRRITFGVKNELILIHSKERLLTLLRRGGTICIGKQESDDESMRIYIKTIDKKKPIPQDHYRARIEITLRGNALPFSNLDDAKNYKFTELSRYFKFRQFKSYSTEGLTLIERTFAIIGERKRRYRKGVGARMYSLSTLAHTALNRIVYDNLRGMGSRLNTGRKRILR